MEVNPENSTPPQSPEELAAQKAQLIEAYKDMLSFRPIWRRMWSTFWGHWFEIIGAGVVISVLVGMIQSGFQFLVLPMQKQQDVFIPLTIVVALLYVVVQMQVQNGWIRYLLQLMRHDDAAFGLFLADPVRIIFSFLGGIAFSVVVTVGYLLLLVPGIIWSVKYRYVLYLIVDKRIGIKQAFSDSAAMTDGLKWRIVTLDARIVLMVLGPLLAVLLLGLAVTYGYNISASWVSPLMIVAVIGAIAYVGYLFAIAGPLGLLHFVVYEFLVQRLISTSGAAQTNAGESGISQTPQAPAGAA